MSKRHNLSALFPSPKGELKAWVAAFAKGDVGRAALEESD